jgi:hypothetical protein
MHKPSLFLGLALVLCCLGCGTGSSSTGGFGGGGTTGSFTNSNLKGSYVYEIVGVDITDNGAPFREAGVFVADGSGNISGGEDDFAEGSTVVSNQVSATSGAYSVSNDGTAVLTLTFNNGGGLQIAMSVVSAPTVYLAVSSVDPQGNPTGLSVNGSGFAVPQTTSALATPSGTFVFRSQNLNTALGGLQPIASAGVFTLSSGTVTSGNEDQLTFGSSDTQLSLTGGLFNAPDAMGRGTATLTDSNAHTSSLFYYIVDGTHLHLFSSASGNIGLGRAVGQTSTTFSGSYVFGSKGDDAFALGGVATVGQFTANAGSITSGGSFDSVVDSGSPVNGSYSGGSFTEVANGRVALTLNPSSGTSVQEIYWVVSPSLAFFITNDSTKVETGTATAQSVTSFSNSSANGTFGFAMDGFNTTDIFDRVGNLHWDGSGHVGLTEFLNQTGNQQLSGNLSGTYSMGSNGRAVVNVANLSSNLVVYLASGTEGYMLQADSGVEINGMMGAAQ